VREVVTAARSSDTSSVRRNELLAQDAAIAAAIAPQVAPFVGMRLGLEGDNEIGLSYTGRGVRADARHAFEKGPWALSVGAGVSGYRPPSRQEVDPETGYTGTVKADAFSYGFDVPVLFGWRSDAGIVSLWGGVRGGYERVSGDVADTPTSPTRLPLALHHWRVGGVAGITLGFRHVHAALELETAYHGVSGDIGDLALKLNGVTLTPAGGLRFTF
jgi:hypothetical protein